MTCFMPPIQRKKKIDEKYNPDSFRVISEDATSDHPKYKPLTYRASFEPRTPTPKVAQQNNNSSAEQFEVNPIENIRPLKNTRVLPQILPDHRNNRPQANSCGFLDKNVASLMEPICNVYTAPVQDQEKQWWPTRTNPGELVVPPYAEDTHYRNDFNYRHGERPEGSGRHTAHEGRQPARGVVPVNHLRDAAGSQKFYKEGMSYEHQYDCRSGPNYPIRGKRHGAFVWSKMNPLSQKKFIDYYQRLNEQEGNRTTPEKAHSAVVVRSNCNHSNNNSGPSSPKRRNSSLSVRVKMPEKAVPTEPFVYQQKSSDLPPAPPKESVQTAECKPNCDIAEEGTSQS